MREVVAPDGRTWKVGRQWLPYRVRLRRERDLPDTTDTAWWLDLFDLAGISLGGILLALSVAIVGILLFAVIWPLVALAVEIVLAIIVFLVVLAGRLVFRRPWRVLARTRDSFRATHAWHVVGWRASERVIDEVAEALAAGQTPRTPAGAERVVVDLWRRS